MENDPKSKYSPPPPIPDFSSQTERRERSFPLHFLQTSDGRTEMLFDHEYLEWDAKLEAWKRECQAIDDAEKAAREAELAAWRPVDPENSPACLPDGMACPEFAESGRRVADSKGQDSPTGSIASSAAGKPESHFPLPTDLEYSRDKAIAALSAFACSVSFSQSGPPRLAPDSMRHSLRCVICAHPDCDAIEGDFVRWRSPIKIAEDYHIADRSSIYRHAHATGLANLRYTFARKSIFRGSELQLRHKGAAEYWASAPEASSLLPSMDSSKEFQPLATSSQRQLRRIREVR